MPRTPNITAVQSRASLAGGPEPASLAAFHVLTPTLARPPKGDNSRAHSWAVFLQPLPSSFLALALPVWRRTGFSPQAFFLLGLPLWVS